MCGIAGYVSNNKKQTKKVLKAMTDRIEHRGPDAEWFFLDSKAALGHRRLSIIDLSTGDQQIYNENKDIAIVFNGEIYNHEEIREDLISKGHVLNSNADTEVLIHGYEEYGEKILDKIRGMFAFSIYDINNQELFMARDFYGIKPLYYYKDKNLFMFGSEIKSFMGHPKFKKELNETSIISKEFLKSMKELYLTIITVCIIAIIFTFMSASIINSVGMVLFWGLLVQALYNSLVILGLGAIQSK